MALKHLFAILLALAVSGCDDAPPAEPSETPKPSVSRLRASCGFEDPSEQSPDCQDQSEDASMVPREGFVGICRLDEEQFPEQFPGQFHYRVLQGVLDREYYLQLDGYGNFTMGLLYVDRDPPAPFLRWDSADSNASLIPIPAGFQEVIFRMYGLVVEGSGRYADAEVRPLWGDHLGKPWLTYEVRVGNEVYYAPGMLGANGESGTLRRPGSFFHEDNDGRLNIHWRSPGSVGIGSAALGNLC